MAKEKGFEKAFEKRIEDFGEEVGMLGKKAGKKVEKFVSREDEFKKIPRLYRSGKEKLLAGVCGGIAEYLKVDPVLIRLVWVALILTGGIGIPLYLIAWIVIPRNPKHRWEE